MTLGEIMDQAGVLKADQKRWYSNVGLGRPLKEGYSFLRMSKTIEVGEWFIGFIDYNPILWTGPKVCKYDYLCYMILSKEDSIDYGVES